MKIVGFAGSNSLNSINKQLVKYASSLFKQDEIELLNLNDFEVDIYRIDREEVNGIPQEIIRFSEKISQADLLIVSLAENNGSYNVAFKNIYDWTSRISNRKVFDGKPMLLMATSPGGRGGIGVLEAAKGLFPRAGADIKGIFSLPSFQENFDSTQGEIINETKKKELIDLVKSI